jgi:putative transposase
MELRRVIDGIFYVNKTGCQWRMLPTNIGNAHTIYGYFRRWRREGIWARIMDTLRQWERQSHGRLPEPSACCADSQSVKTATQGEDVGFDGHKKIKGRKRHILVDTLGLIVAVVVTAANMDDRLGLESDILLRESSACVRSGWTAAIRRSGCGTGFIAANGRTRWIWK